MLSYGMKTAQMTTLSTHDSFGDRAKEIKAEGQKAIRGTLTKMV